MLKGVCSVFVKLAMVFVLVFTIGATGCSGGSGGRGTDAGGDATGAATLEGVFVPTGSLTVARFGQTATLLGNGMVLIAGGAGSSAELYNPNARTFTPTRMVLIAGGDELASTELYDPNAETFTATGNMTVARQGHTATLLPNGMVLIAGGDDWQHRVYTTPMPGHFTAAGSMTEAMHTATLLPDGEVLIASSYAGGVNAELYDPVAGTFTATGSMSTAGKATRRRCCRTGRCSSPADGITITAARCSSLRARSYTTQRPGHSRHRHHDVAREYHTATLLPSGKVLIAGGLSDGGDLASAELYDPEAGTFQPPAA